MSLKVQSAMNDNIDGSKVSYDGASSGMDATNLQDAVDELNTEKAPTYTYGTADLTAGSSALATGTLYFRYE